MKNHLTTILILASLVLALGGAISAAVRAPIDTENPFLGVPLQPAHHASSREALLEEIYLPRPRTTRTNELSSERYQQYLADQQRRRRSDDHTTISDAQAENLESNASPPPLSSSSSQHENNKPATLQDDGWRTKCAQRCEERILDVVGFGIQALQTDKAEVRATIEYRKMLHNTTTALNDTELASMVTSVQQEVSRVAAAVVTFLHQDPTVAPHVSKLRTTGLALEPLNEWFDNRQRLIGYRAANSITFRVDIAVAGQAIDGIVAKGVNRIDGISFVASPKILNAARQTAIMAAVEDAMEQALVSSKQ